MTGVSVSITKKYRPQIWVAWAIYMIGMGVYTTIRADTRLAETIGIPILTGVGAGMLYRTSRSSNAQLYALSNGGLTEHLFC